MNRHHPYGGYEGPRRGGGSPQGPGPDRYTRFGRGAMRGGRGGRGGAPTFYNGDDYDDGGYNNNLQGYNVNGAGYEDPFYAQEQGQQMGVPPAPSFSSPDGYGAYEQHPLTPRTLFLDKPQSPGHGQFGPSNRGKRPNPRKERDDKIHDSLIEERIQRERPCRTLFIRNIKYETDSNDVRRIFEEHGEIKTFFDLIGNRGMVFVTYYDLRAAERARERLQGSEISGRPIDVHYSLPRGDEQQQQCDRDKNQGTLLVTLRNSPSGQPIDDAEVRRKFQQFGDVKSVKSAGDRPDQRYVELYDIRACEEAHDRLRHQGLQDGVMEIVFAWDVPDQPLPPGPFPPTKRAELRDRPGEQDDRTFRGRGGRGRGGGGYRGGRERDHFRDRDPRDRELDDWERDRTAPRDDWSRDRRKYEDMGPGSSSRGGRYDDRDRGGYGPSNVPSSGPPDDRLEQAKKVQQLLAALKQPAAGTPPPPPPSLSGPPPRMPMPPPPMPPPGTGPLMNPYYPPPPSVPQQQQPPPYMPPPPPNLYAPYSHPPPQQQQQQQQQQQHHQNTPSMSPPVPPSGLAPGLPPNILALLQQAQQQAQHQGMPPQGSQPQHQGSPPMQYSMPSQQQSPPQNTPNPPPPPPALQNPQYEQLLAFMQAQQKRT